MRDFGIYVENPAPGQPGPRVFVTPEMLLEIREQLDSSGFKTQTAPALRLERRVDGSSNLFKVYNFR